MLVIRNDSLFLNKISPRCPLSPYTYSPLVLSLSGDVYINKWCHYNYRSIFSNKIYGFSFYFIMSSKLQADILSILPLDILYAVPALRLNVLLRLPRVLKVSILIYRQAMYLVDQFRLCSKPSFIQGPEWGVTPASPPLQNKRYSILCFVSSVCMQIKSGA